MLQIKPELIMFIIVLLTIDSLISSLLTEAIKNWCKNADKAVSSNVLALIMAIIVGGVGTLVCYILGSVEFTLVTITVLICMIPLVWIGSMVGFDKVKQTFSQIAKVEAE